MRKLYLAIVAALALSLYGCGVEEISEPRSVAVSGGLTVNFTTCQADTKTAFTAYDGTSDSYPVVWTAADSKIGMSLNYSSPVEASVSINQSDSRYADITATFDDGGTPYRFYAFSPVSAVKAVSASRTGWTVTIPTVQTPLADGLSCDEAAMLLCAQTGQLTTIPSNPIPLTFSHVTSYCRLVLKNLDSALAGYGADGASVLSIDVTFQVPVAGDWYVKASDGTLSEKDASYTITVKPTITDLANPGEIWFALAPCVLDGKTVKVKVNTDKGAISRTYTYGTRTYQAGSVNRLTLDMSKNTEFERRTSVSYVLVNSISELSAGDEVIILDSPTGPTYGMTSTACSTSGLECRMNGAEDGFVLESDGSVSLPNTSAIAVWTVASLESSSIVLKSGDLYFSHMKFGTSYYASTSSTTSSFNIAIDSGAAQIYYSSSSSTKYALSYDLGNYFNLGISGSFSSETRQVAVYRKVTLTENPDLDPILGKTEYGAYLSDSETTYTPGECQLSREYDAVSTTFAVLFPSKNTALEFGGVPSRVAKGDSFELTVSRAVGRKTTVVGKYNVTVLKEDGAKLWLSDLEGNGFIVKR